MLYLLDFIVTACGLIKELFKIGKNISHETFLENFSGFICIQNYSHTQTHIQKNAHTHTFTHMQKNAFTHTSTHKHIYTPTLMLTHLHHTSTQKSI